MNQKTKETMNGHGFFRKTKAYGLVCGIVLSTAFLGANVSAEEIATTQNETSTEQTGSQTIVSPPSEQLTDATESAQNAGSTVTQGQTQNVADADAAQKDYDEQAADLARIAKEQEVINAQNAQNAQTNQANTQAAAQAQDTADNVNKYVDDLVKQHSDSTVNSKTIDYGSGSASDIQKGEQQAKAVDAENKEAVKRHEEEEAKRAEAISNQAQIDKENHEKWVKFLNDNYVRNLTGVTNEVVKTDNIKSLTSSNSNSVITKDGSITNISTALGAGQSVTHIFEFIKPVMLFQSLEVGRLEETINLLSSQNQSGTTTVIQRSGTGGGVQYNTDIPTSSVLIDGFTNYTRSIKFYTVDGKLITPELLREAINKSNGVFGLSKEVSTISEDEFSYDTIKNNDTTSSKVTLRYFEGKGDNRTVASSKTFDTIDEALAYLKANPATSTNTGTSILQEGNTFDEVNHQYYAVRNSQLSFEFLNYISPKANTTEDGRSGQSFSFGGGFSVANTDFIPADSIVIPTVSTLSLTRVLGEIKPTVIPEKAPLKAEWHLNQYKHNLVAVKDVLNLEGVSIDGGQLQIGDKAVYTLTGAKVLANGKDKLVKYDFEDILDIKHDKYLGYRIYAFTPIKLVDGTIIESMADLKEFASQIYDEVTGRFYVSLNSDFLAKISKDSDFQVKVEVDFERIKAGEVLNTFKNYLVFEDKEGNIEEVPVPSNSVKTTTPELPVSSPEAPKPTPQPEAPVAQTVLPTTGEASSILSLLGGLSLFGLGAVGRRRKK